MRSPLLLAAFFGPMLSGCNLIEQPTRMLPQETRNWRTIATAHDRARLREWRGTFVKAVAAARGTNAADVEREGVLLQPDAAIGGPIPNGTYRCRVIKLGAKAKGLLDYVSYPAFTCRITPENSLQKFRKLGGSQRQVGILFPGDPLRQVFLGTLALGDELGALQYGLDEGRNVAGYVERIGPTRWRLIMPQPRFESQLDVMELTPAPGAQS
jgi:hypothetical protein